jgi:isoaspartyl peptidase/L-asparaginase-like protein (Ntn-hydrolase superfamily)
MKYSRRQFIKMGGLASAGILLNGASGCNFGKTQARTKKAKVVYTWDYGPAPGNAALDVLAKGESALDALEAGIKIVESDPNVLSVGYGGLPDASGEVTLDASIMDWKGNAGAVAYLKNIKHPISVARLVMEKTPHVLLVGEGALKFALENGFKKENLLTNKAKARWEKWKAKHSPGKNHDTVGMLIIDEEGNISGGVSTSGWAFKIPGRVGDSPIIGAGLYVDNEVGGACSTGYGEIAIKTAGSFLVVEKMREGYSPAEACKIAVERSKKYQKDKHMQICYVAMNKAGEVGGYSAFEGFVYTIADKKGVKLKKSEYLF